MRRLDQIRPAVSSILAMFILAVSDCLVNNTKCAMVALSAGSNRISTLDPSGVGILLAPVGALWGSPRRAVLMRLVAHPRRDSSGVSAKYGDCIIIGENQSLSECYYMIHHIIYA